MENAQIDQGSHSSDKEVGEKTLYPASTSTGDCIDNIEQTVNQRPGGRMITGEEARSSRPFHSIQDFCSNIKRFCDVQGFRNFLKRARCCILFHRDSKLQCLFTLSQRPMG